MKFNELNTEITLEAHSFSALGAFLCSNNYSRCAVITSEPMASLLLPDVLPYLENPLVMTLQVSEEKKTLQTVESCWETMRDNGLDRYSLLISLGGGVISDITGFAAACYMRGIDCVHIPTTLLGMIDGALGGKNGVNLGPNKNYIGTFHQPKLVAINLDCLDMLPARELKSGFAEIIKIAAVCDAKLFEFLELNTESLLKKSDDELLWVIERACHLKMRIVTQDANENNVRSMLNFGHTFGHALEGLMNYQGLLHGEAVAIGIMCAANLAEKLGYCQPEVVQRIQRLCQAFELPITLPSEIDPERLVDLMMADKKAFQGSLTLVLPQAIGMGDKFTNVSKEDILSSLLSEVCYG
ncbi:MAG: 3-dehydroquinate synthase [Chlamydiales bacterium]|nr:3-dehydroquinate synthase [Chlamydiales bacterium]